MKNTKEKIKLIIFIAIIVILTILKLVLVNNQPLYAKFSMKYDDKLMVNLANNIVQGKWLGEYDSFTLIKGAFTPLFVALIYKIGIPFLLSQNILYILACITFILVIKRIIPNKFYLILIYIVLLFNPVTYASDLLRVYRDGIYTSLILFLISFVFGIFLNYKESLKKIILYMIGFGLTFAAISICREETIWIMPFIIAATIMTILFIVFDKNCIDKTKRILLYFIPISIYLVTILSICTLNYRYYGRFITNDYNSKEFKDAYGALTRVIPEEKIEKVPVSKEIREKLYEISPKFSELKEYFNNIEIVNGWISSGDSSIRDIQGGWMFWALRDAVEQKGYYKDANTAKQYYIDLAKEINDACDEGKLNALKKRSSLTSPFDINQIQDLLKEIEKTIKFEYTLDKMYLKVPMTLKSSLTESDILFEKLTRNKSNRDNTYLNKKAESKVKKLENIKEIYKKCNKYILPISIVIYVIYMIMMFIKKTRNKLYKEFLLLSGLLSIYICRIFIVAFIGLTAYESAISVLYLSSIYGVQFIFSILSIIFTVDKLIELIRIIKLKKGKKYGKGNRVNNINAMS